MNRPSAPVKRPASRLAMLQTLGAFITGVLVVLSFPLYGHRFGLDHLIWVALAPLVAMATGVGARRGLFLGLVAGATLDGAGFVWIYLSIVRFTNMPAILSALAFMGQLLYAIVPWAVLGWGLGRCRREADLFWVGMLWIAVESCFPRLFPWHIGGALYGRRELAQCADLFGASGLSALVFLVNVVVVFAWKSRRSSRDHPAETGFAWGRRIPWRTGIAAGVLLVAAVGYGHLRLAQLTALNERAPALEVGIVQGAKTPLSSALSSAEYFQAAARQLEYYVTESTALIRAAEAAGKPLDLLVWPEGVDEFPLGLDGPDPWRWHPEAVPAAVLKFLKSPPVPLVFGTGGWHRRRVPKASNVAVFVTQDGIQAIYEKMALMPFGERVPLLDLIPQGVRDKMGLRVGNMYAGTENPVVKVKGRSFRLLICYEAILPAFVRPYTDGVDFFVNVTEDVWYGRTAHIPQHVSVLILRAIENRVPLVRCTNMGPSGVIGFTGAFDPGESVFAPTSVGRTVVPGSSWSLYRAGGFVFPWVALGAVLIRWGWRRWGPGGRPGPPAGEITRR